MRQNASGVIVISYMKKESKMDVKVPAQASEELLEKDCDDCEKEEKGPKYLALYTNGDGFLQYVTATSASQLKKALEQVPLDHIELIWKGKPKQIRTKSVITF